MEAKSFFATASLFPILLPLGILMRAPALWHPVEEGQRNAQTACLTANMVEDGRLRLDPIAPWRGDLEARLVQELPLYNIFVLALSQMPGITLDLAGRLVSLGCWALGFWLLQSVWRLTLPETARPWGNLLFIFSPMNWYLSTAFMPETFLQTLSIGFLALALKYAKNLKGTDGVALLVVGAIGMLVKLPSFVHLGLFLILILLDRQGWQALFRPVLLIGACLILSGLLAWSHFMETVNSAYFPYWTGKQNLLGFIQPGYERWGSTFWIKLSGYNLAYVLPLVAALPAAWGFLIAWNLRHTSFEARIWLYLFVSLFLSWLVWGKGAAAQNYYNLPNLVCFCAFFGLGMERLQARLPFFSSPRWIQVCFCIFLFSGIVWCGTGNWYLSRPDTTTLQAADWVEQNTAINSLILYQPRHSSAVMDYEHQPLLSHASGRRTWIWTRSTPNWEKQRALETASYFIVTLPPEKPDFWETLRRRAKSSAPQCPNRLSKPIRGFFKKSRKQSDLLSLPELQNPAHISSMILKAWLGSDHLRGRFFRAWGSSNLSLIATSIYSMGMVALVIREIGVAQLGLWALIVQFTGYLGLLDSGVTAACIRRFVGPIARKESGEFPVMFQAACIVSCFQGVACWLLIFGVPPLAALLDVPIDLQGIFVKVMTWQFFLTGFFFMFRPFTSLLLAAQRFEVNNLVSATGSLVSLGIIWLSLRAGLGLWALVGVTLFQQLLGAATTLWMVRQLSLLPAAWRIDQLPWIRIRTLFRESLDFFSWTGFTTVNALLQSIFLSRFMGLEAVALWNVGSKFATLFYTFISSSLNNAFPTLTEVFELGQVRECRKLCQKFLVLSLVGAGSLGIGYILANEWIVEIWTAGLITFPLSLSAILAVWLVLATAVRALACYSNVWHQRVAMRRGPMVETGFFTAGLALALLGPSPWTLGFALLLGQVAPLLLVYFPAWKKVVSTSA